MNSSEFPSNPEQIAPLDRSLLLEAFADNPTDESIWHTAYAWTRHEGDDDSTVSVEELITMAERVRNSEQADRYALTTEQTITGQRWFDVLSTFSSGQIERTKHIVLSDYADQLGGTFGKALDLATGTGKSLASLESVSDTVVGIDRNPDLLAAAKENKGGQTELILADVASLPFEAESFDLVSSSGVEVALGQTENKLFYQEIERVLTPGGLYIDGTYYDGLDGTLGAEMNAITDSSKAMLLDMVVDSVSGKLQNDDPLLFKDQVSLLNELGLKTEYFLVEDPVASDGTVTLIRTIRKPL